MTPIDSLGFGVSIHNAASFLPSSYRLEVNSADYYYWTGLVMVLFTLFCCIRLRDSRLGRAWVAIREDEIAAAAMGVPLMRTKTLAYAIGAFFGGMAGCFYAIFKSSTFPQDFSLNISIAVLCMVILGGMGNVWGVCLGGAVLSYLNYQGLEAVGNNVNNDRGHELQHPPVHVRHLRHHHRGDDAGPAAGADTHRTAEDRAGGRRRGRIALRRRPA